MFRSSLIVLGICALIASPILAAEPTVTKSIFAETADETVLIVQVSAADQEIFGINLSDASGSITDIFCPKGWVGISSGDRVTFRTDEPISLGQTVKFRIVTTDKSAPLGITFRDKKSPIHMNQNI
jgi:hypothetical protein